MREVRVKEVLLYYGFFQVIRKIDKTPISYEHMLLIQFTKLVCLFCIFYSDFLLFHSVILQLLTHSVNFHFY